MRIMVVAVVVGFCYGVFAQEVKEGDGKIHIDRAIWVDNFISPISMRSMIANLRKSNIGAIIVCAKPANGRILWQSKKFKETVADGIGSFDPLRNVIEEAHKEGLKVIVALSALRDDGIVVKKNPDWAMRDAEGKIQDKEVWMCPARRNGYVEQWLLPMIEELVKNYEIDGVHLYDVNYPPSAPDGFCFCDWCLENFWKWVGLGKREWKEKASFADWRLKRSFKPDGWDNASRKVKVEFLLGGSLFQGTNRGDVDIVFCDYRCDATGELVKKVSRVVRSNNREVSFSVSVFGNPRRAARFAGQRWTDWVEYVDFLVVDLGRGNYTESYEDYLRFVKDDVKEVKEIVGNRAYVYAMVNLRGLYREEVDSLAGIVECLEVIKETDNKSAVCEKIEKLYSMVAERLKASDSGLMKEVDAAIMELKRTITSGGSVEEIGSLLKQNMKRLQENPPKGFYRSDSVKQIMRALEDGGADGVLLVSSEIVEKFGFWDEIAEMLGDVKPVVEQESLEPSMGVVRKFLSAETVIRALKQKIKALEEKTADLAERLKTEEGGRTEAQKVVETLLKKIETISAEASLLEKELAKAKEENRQLVAGLEKERKGYSAKEEALASAMEMEKAKRQAAEDMVKVLKSQVDSVEKKMMELNQELAENIRKLGERQEQERFVMLAAFLVAAVSFSVALVISIAARRKPPSEES